MVGLDVMVGMLRAAGEDTRLRLLLLLAEGEHTVKDLTEILGQSQPRVSRHLKLLTDAGLVERHAEGAWAYYGLARRATAGELTGWLLANVARNAPSLAGDRARQSALRASQEAEASAYFATVARDWDRWRSLHVPESAVEAAIVAVLANRDIGLLVDLGTGTGRMLELLADRYRRGLGIDASREMLAVARSRLAGAGIAHAQVRLGDIVQIEPLTEAADVIVLHQVLHYFDDPGRIISRARRLLGPGGELLIVDFAPHALEFLRIEHAHRRLGLSDTQMQGWAAAAGLDLTQTRAFPSENGSGGLTVGLWRLTDAGRSIEETRP